MAKDDDDAPAKNKKETVVRNDAYTGMLIIALLALGAGTLLLFLDLSRYGFTGKPTPPHAITPAVTDPTAKTGDGDEQPPDKKGKLPPPDDGKKGPLGGKQPDVK